MHMPIDPIYTYHLVPRWCTDHYLFDREMYCVNSLFRKSNLQLLANHPTIIPIELGSFHPHQLLFTLIYTPIPVSVTLVGS